MIMRAIACHASVRPSMVRTDCPSDEVNPHCRGNREVYGVGGAACDTVNVCPAIVSVPVRAAALFTATANATVPLPVPDAAPVSVSQGAFAVAVHAHVLAEAVTATEPAPPVSATF